MKYAYSSQHHIEDVLYMGYPQTELKISLVLFTDSYIMSAKGNDLMRMPYHKELE